MDRLPFYIFLLFIFFLPQQFGPHFWPAFSYVHGIRVDYLSLSIYISDVLVFFLFITSFKNVFLHKQVQKFLFSKLFILLVITFLIPLLYSKSPANIFYAVFLFAKFLYVGLFTAVKIKKNDLIPISFVFLIGGVFESLLSIFQYIKQQSIGGPFYFFGERILFLSGIGVAVINTGRELLLRPYGTFPHPNVLAFYLLVCFIFGIYYLTKLYNGLNLKQHFTNFINIIIFLQKAIIILFLLTIQVGIALSFSRTVLILNLLFLVGIGLLFSNVKNFRKISLILILCILVLISFLVFFSNRIANFEYISSAIIPRIDLLKINFEILKYNLFFGVGLNNYLFHQVEFQKTFSSIYLQPVHNIYLLTAVQTGVFGFMIILYFFYKTTKKLWRLARAEKNKFNVKYFLLTILCFLFFVGLFDHYPLTIIQGQFLTSVILGLCWNKNILKD